MSTPSTADPGRVDCAVAETCGGCALIRLPYDAQIERKRARMAEAIGRYAELGDVVVAPMAAAGHPQGYRTRAKLAAARREGAVHLGLYRPGTHEVTDIPDCPVLHPAVREAANAVRRVFARPPFETLELTYVSIRYSREARRAHLTFVLRHDAPDLARDAAAALMGEAPSLAGVTLNLNPGPPLRVFGPTFRPLAGEERLVEAIGGRRFPLGPGAFFQANPEQAEAVVAIAREHTGEVRGRLVDFYAGAGVLALCLAAPEAEVVAVEAYGAAADDARLAARENGFARFRVVAAPAERAAAAICDEVGRADVVALNPPRKGCSPAVLRALARLAPDRAVYVSCDPTTLARDLAALARLGYRARRVVPVDMLPQTDHVEAVALLEPSAGGPRARRVAVLFEDDDVVVVDKPPLVPVQAGAGTTRTLLDLLAEERGDEARGWRLVHRLDAETSGVIVLAKDREAARRLAESFQRGEVGKRYLCLARGIAREKGVVNRPLAVAHEPPQPARTRYRRLMLLRGHSLLAVTPETGRLHQIRRHLSAIGHAIIGDERHGDAATNRHFAERYAVGRLLLHAAALSFPHPRTGERIAVAAPLPGDFAEVVARLGLSRPLETAGLLRGLGEPRVSPRPPRPTDGGSSRPRRRGR